MKVVFVYPDLNLGKFNLGIGYLSSVLKRGGHDTDLVHVANYMDRDDFCQVLESKKPDLVAFSSCTNMFSYTLELSSWAKDVLKDIPTICGGVHPTLCPEEVIAQDSLDIACIGEGEYSLLELCNNLENGSDISAIPNLWVKNKGRILRNDIRPLVADLDELPFADRSIFSKNALIEDESLKACFVMVSRGCPYSCSYCSNQAFHELYRHKGTYLRFRSVDNVITELKLLTKENDFNAVIFHDDILPIKKEWLRDFTRAYKNHIGLPFICNLRVELADKDSLSMLKSAGCIQICFGVESGNDFIRKEIMHRPMSKEQIINAFDFCRDLGIKTKSFNMVGLPFENMDRILETIKLNVRARPDVIQVSIFYPYPGTDLFELSKKNNFITDKKLISYFDGSILSLPTLSAEQIYFARKRFVKMFKRYLFYKKLPVFIGWILEWISDAAFKSKFAAKSYVVQRKISQALKARRKKRKVK